MDAQGTSARVARSYARAPVTSTISIMNLAGRLTAAVLLASLVPPALFALVMLALVGAEASANGAPFLLLAAWLVGLAHLVVFGGPAFIYLRRRQRLRWHMVSVLGFLAGLVPHLLMYPRTLEGYSSGANWHGRYVDFYLNGTPTEYAWWSYVEQCFTYGIYGAVTALAMWCAWQWLGSQGVRT